MRAAALALAGMVCSLLASCGQAPGYPPNPVARPGDVLDFPTLYAQNCSACHGSTGQGGAATDLANPEYEALIDDATLRKWIGGGMPGTQMPAFAKADGGMLADAQVTAIMAGMRREWSRPNAFGGATPPPYPQVKGGDPHRGQQVFASRCEMCHKSSSEQIVSPVYLALVSDQALRSFIVAGSPDIGHPDWRHDGTGGKAATPLSAVDVDDVIAYLGTLRNAAPGFAGTAAETPAKPAGRQTN